MYSCIMLDIGPSWDEETIGRLLGLSPHDISVQFVQDDNDNAVNVAAGGDNTRQAKLSFVSKVEMRRTVMAYQGLVVPMTHGYYFYSFSNVDDDYEGEIDHINYMDATPPLHLQLMALPTTELERRLNQLGGDSSRTKYIKYHKKGGHRMCKVFRHASLAFDLAQKMGNNRPTKKCVGVPVPDKSVDDLLEYLRSSEKALWPRRKNQRKGVSAGQYLTVRKQHPPEHDQVWDLCEKLIRGVIPEAVYNALAITEGFRGSPHVDNHDKSFQHVIALGSFDGGSLCAEADDDGKEVVDINVKCRFGRIDGRAVHWVNGWRGERYSIVYYTTSDDDLTKLMPQSVHTKWMENICRTMNENEAGKVPQRKYARANSRLPRTTPLLGLGCSSFSSFFSSQEEESLTADTINREHFAAHGWIETIRHAVLNRGIYLLDTAPWYGHGISEITVGYALDTLLTNDSENEDVQKNSTLSKLRRRKRTGSLPRSRLIVNTKVGRYDSNPLHQFDFSYDTTIQSVHRSLERMNCTYIDVIQLHDPEFAPSISLLKEETIPALLECRKRGWAKAIGLTGYPLEVQHQVLVEYQGLSDDGIVFDQSLAYCHNNLHDMSLYSDPCFPSLNAGLERKEKDEKITFAQFCQQIDIRLMVAAPLSMGLLTTAGPPSWHPAGQALKEGCATAAKMCDAKGVNISSLALLYSFSQPEVGCTLLGMKDVKEVDVAADLAMRFCGVNFDADEGSKETNNQLRHYTILDQVLTQEENEALKLIMDKTYGPFVNVISNGEYRWDGKEEARRFWVLVGELKKGQDEEVKDLCSNVPGSVGTR